MVATAKWSGPLRKPQRRRISAVFRGGRVRPQKAGRRLPAGGRLDPARPPRSWRQRKVPGSRASAPDSPHRQTWPALGRCSTATSIRSRTLPAACSQRGHNRHTRTCSQRAKSPLGIVRKRAASPRRTPGALHLLRSCCDLLYGLGGLLGHQLHARSADRDHAAARRPGGIQQRLKRRQDGAKCLDCNNVSVDHGQCLDVQLVADARPAAAGVALSRSFEASIIDRHIKMRPPVRQQDATQWHLSPNIVFASYLPVREPRSLYLHFSPPRGQLQHTNFPCHGAGW